MKYLISTYTSGLREATWKPSLTTKGFKELTECDSIKKEKENLYHMSL